MSDEKVYVGNAKKITTQYGELMKLSITEEDLKKMQENLSNGWINIVVKERRSPSAGGMTHYLEVDTWKPEPQNKEGGTPQETSAPAATSVAEEPSPEDLPF